MQNNFKKWPISCENTNTGCQGYSPDVAFRWFLSETGPPLPGAQKVRKDLCSFSNISIFGIEKRPPLYVVVPKKCFNWEAKYITSQGVDIYNVLEYFPCFPNKEKFVVKSDCFVFLPITADFSITSNFDQNYHQPCLLWWKMISFVNQNDSGQNGPGLFMGYFWLKKIHMTKYEHLCDVLYWQYFHLIEHSQSILEVNITAIKFQEQIEAETKLPQNVTSSSDWRPFRPKVLPYHKRS